MTLLWIRAHEFRRVADDPVAGRHLTLVPSVTTAPEVGPRLHLRELREYGLRVDPIHAAPVVIGEFPSNSRRYSLDPHRALAWWAKYGGDAA